MEISSFDLDWPGFRFWGVHCRCREITLFWGFFKPKTSSIAPLDLDDQAISKGFKFQPAGRLRMQRITESMVSDGMLPTLRYSHSLVCEPLRGSHYLICPFILLSLILLRLLFLRGAVSGRAFTSTWRPFCLRPGTFTGSAGPEKPFTGRLSGELELKTK